MESMRFKDYVWEYNPFECTLVCERDVAKHRYPELAGAELEDFNPDAAVITGTGEFFGENAYQKWKELWRLFKKDGIGEFFHPIFDDVIFAAFKRLEANIEPRENYVSYSFEFWQHIPVVERYGTQSPIKSNPQKVVNGKTGFDCLVKNGCRGGMVKKVQQALIKHGYDLPKFGADGKFGSETASKIRAFQAANELAVDGIVGKNTADKLNVTFTQCTPCVRTNKGRSAISGRGASGTIYTVQVGDTLSHIAKRYGIPWKQLASHNGLKNPHKIQIGQKIKIPGDANTPSSVRNRATGRG